MTTNINKTATSWRLNPATRKTILVLHIISGISWMGIDIALFTLLMTGRSSNDATLVISAFNAIRIIVPAAVPALSISILVTGLILGLGTPWGLFRYWWVFVKLILSTIMTVLVFVSLVPGVNEIAGLDLTVTSADAVRASLGSIPDTLMYPPIVSFSMLGVAAILSVFKPWKFTPWSKTKAKEIKNT